MFIPLTHVHVDTHARCDLHLERQHEIPLEMGVLFFPTAQPVLGAAAAAAAPAAHAQPALLEPAPLVPISAWKVLTIEEVRAGGERVRRAKTPTVAARERKESGTGFTRSIIYLLLHNTHTYN